MARTQPTVNDPFAFGIIIPAIGIGQGSSMSTFGTSGRCLFARTLNGGTISKVRIEVGTASGNISVAAYQNTGTGASAQPTGAPLATSGAVACPATGIADVSLGSSVTLAPGDWLALSYDNTVATFRVVGLTTTGLFPGLGYRQDAAHPAPTVGTLAATSSLPILLGMP